jgi:hypothetical protein
MVFIDIKGLLSSVVVIAGAFSRYFTPPIKKDWNGSLLINHSDAGEQPLPV